MKQTIFALVLMLGMSLCVQAQDNKQERRRPDKNEMVKMRTDRMAERYGLNDNQKAALLKLNTQYADSMAFGGQRGPRGIRNFDKNAEVKVEKNADVKVEKKVEKKSDVKAEKKERPSREQMQAQMKKFAATQQAYEAEVKKILTEEQYGKYTEDRKQMRQGRPGRRSNGPRGDRPRRNSEE